MAVSKPSRMARIDRCLSWAANHQNKAFFLGVGVACFLIFTTTILPLRQKNDTLSQREVELDARIAGLTAEREELASLVDALENDPYALEVAIRQLLRKRRPDEVPLSRFLAMPRPATAMPD